ncbi:MAG: hypothetical protein AAF989_11365 [Planctomycetota bacterium]
MGWFRWRDFGGLVFELRIAQAAMRPADQIQRRNAMGKSRLAMAATSRIKVDRMEWLNKIGNANPKRRGMDDEHANTRWDDRLSFDVLGWLGDIRGRSFHVR